MLPGMEEKWKRSVSIFLALLVAGAITYCLFPSIKAVFRLAAPFFPQRTVSVTVYSAGVNGGAVMWLSAPKGSRVLEEMQKVPSSSRYSGICEYRKAEDYGYACDFLVSYGDNVGSSFEISYSPIIDSELQIWCCSGGAILEIRNRDKEPIYFDSCSEVGVLESVELCSARLKTLCLGSVALVVWAACALALYCVLPVLAGKPLPVGGRTDDASIGLARTTAAFLVAYVHSFLTEGGSVSYYHTPLDSALMGAASMLRWLAFCCVPLFMLLTGFLCVRRTSFWNNVGRLIPMLSSFLIVCILHLLLKCFYWHTPITIQYAVSTILGMDLAWYLEMYIGLALLLPFLNILWKNLEQEQRATLICVLLFLTTLGSITENLLPTWWVTIYPLTYYYVGAWLREYPVGICRGNLLAALLITLGLETLRTFSDAAGGAFPWAALGGSINAYYSAPITLSTVLLFLLLLGMDVRPHFLRQFLIKAGRHTLTTYLLLTAVSENLFWTAVRPHFPTYELFFPVQLPLTAVLYLATLAVAIVIDTAVQFFWNWLQKREKELRSSHSK